MKFEGNLYDVTHMPTRSNWKPLRDAEQQADNLQNMASTASKKSVGIIIGLVIFLIIWEGVLHLGLGLYLLLAIIALGIYFHYRNKKIAREADEIRASIAPLYLDYTQQFVEPLAQQFLKVGYRWQIFEEWGLLFNDQAFVYFNLDGTVCAYSKDYINSVSLDRKRLGSHTESHTSGDIVGTTTTVGSSVNYSTSRVVNNHISTNGNSIGIAQSVSNSEVNLNTQGNSVDEYQLTLTILLKSINRPHIIKKLVDTDDNYSFAQDVVSILNPRR